MNMFIMWFIFGVLCTFSFVSLSVAIYYFVDWLKFLKKHK
jgi:hypothetical protein